MIKLKALSVVGTVLAFAQTASAASLYNPNMVESGNHWTISAYDDSSSDHAFIASVGVCFFKDGIYGSEMQYVWASDTFPGFGGRAAQEGDQVKVMGGDTASAPSYFDAMSFEIVTANPTNMAAGHWWEWMPSSSGLFLPTSTVYATLTMVRDGPCPYATAADILQSGALRLDTPTHTSPIGAAGAIQ